jgi:hypothetical protein
MNVDECKYERVPTFLSDKCTTTLVLALLEFPQVPI